MTPLRRHTDDGESPMRRREDQLQEVVDELRELNHRGSENFRRYRRWSLLAFVVLIAAFTIGLKWVWDTKADTKRVDRIAHRADTAAARANVNTGRIDKVNCAFIHYLERGQQITALDPRQAIITNEIKIVLRQLKPLAPGCPPAPPIKGLPSGR